MAGTNTHIVFSEDVPVISITKGDVPVILHVPHASSALPGSLTRECRPAIDFALEADVMADTGTDLLARHISSLISRQFGGSPYIVSSLISRILVDMERFDSDQEEMNVVGMGVVYERSHDLKEMYSAPLTQQVTRRRKECYRLYSSELAKLSREIADRFGHLVFLDIHSYAVDALPYELHKERRRPRLCVGADTVNPAAMYPAQAVVAAHPETTWLNEPFAGSYCPLDLWGDERVVSLMLEHRKDSYDMESGLPSPDVSAVHLDIASRLAKLGGDDLVVWTHGSACPREL